MKWIGKLLMKLIGWTVESRIPEDCKKCIIVIAPHTSNWDFIIGRIAFWVLQLRVRFLIKKEWFWFPFKYIMYGLGAIPVDRQNNKVAIRTIAERIKKSKQFYLVITPEGTRKRVNVWKKGFYNIALQAQVPLILGYLDYPKKHCCADKYLMPSGNLEEDLKIIREFYADKTASNPDNFNKNFK